MIDLDWIFMVAIISFLLGGVSVYLAQNMEDRED